MIESAPTVVLVKVTKSELLHSGLIEYCAFGGKICTESERKVRHVVSPRQPEV